MMEGRYTTPGSGSTIIRLLQVHVPSLRQWLLVLSQTRLVQALPGSQAFVSALADGQEARMAFCVRGLSGRADYQVLFAVSIEVPVGQGVAESVPGLVGCTPKSCLVQALPGSQAFGSALEDV